MMPKPRAALPFVLSLVIAPAACSSSSSEPGKTADAASEAGGFAESACGKCVAQACSSEAQACAGDAQCAAWLTCVQSCPIADGGGADPACTAQCVLPPSGPGADAEQAFAQCMDQGAGAACVACGKSTDAGVDADAAASCPPSSSSNPCTHCTEEHCCDATASCSNNAECLALGSCYVGCAGDYPCQLKCVDDHPDGVAAYGHAQACQLVSCSGPTDCNGGACAECVAEKCGSLYDACWSNAECFRFARCFITCPPGDSQCATACQQASPNGVAEFDAFVLCENDQCGTSC